MLVRTSASGELLELGQLKSIFMYALGDLNSVSGLYHKLYDNELLNNDGNLHWKETVNVIIRNMNAVHIYPLVGNVLKTHKT